MWVLEGDTGKVLEGWPVKLPSQVLAAVLVTKLVPGERNAADIVSTKHTKNPTIDKDLTTLPHEVRVTSSIFSMTSSNRTVVESKLTAGL